MRRTLRVDNNINRNVKVGDKVMLTNDETLTHVVYDNQYDLLRKYPSIGIHKPLEDVLGTVTHIGITDFVVQRDDKFVTYTQDIVVNLEGQMFRTSSKAVRVIRTPMEIIEARLDRLRAFRTGSDIAQRDIRVAIDLLEAVRDEINNHKIG